QSIIVVGASYFNRDYSDREINEEGRALIARYAWGDDYHDVIKDKLKQIVHLLDQEFGQDLEHKVFAGTGPVLEKDLARQAGLGFVGKNSVLINPKIGSYFVLGSIFTQILYEEYKDEVPTSCGSCQKCIKACPTGAIIAPYVIDARKCIAYHTVENRGKIPKNIREKMKNRIFGCDICQEVCPWNRFAKKTRIGEFEIKNNRDNLSRGQLIQMNASDFDQLFAKSAVKRRKYQGFKRNLGD
ncbi:tRNA epoxyqueuosine(34) reductase QueG, partial [Patescibacteria group bacterium]|nr:tRNA epoxyqueuosine(34) reductase QueG [Patescibacteria group bacterium]